jgi:iron complex outermembrane receptor protein
MISKMTLTCGTSLLAAVALLPTAAMAQKAKTADPVATSGIQDIVVTARRTNENLQTVPVAVTALTNASLAQKQVVQVLDLARTAPSLSIGTGGTGPASIVYLAIRGQAQNSPNSFSDSSVGIYIDGVYVARPIVGNLGLLDMAGAEILRGPQGTLFGRNTTGGALNLTSNQPTNKLEGLVKVGFGNYSSRLLQGVLNVPLSSDLAVRVVGSYDEHGAYFPNPVSGIGQGDVAGDYFARATIKWTPAGSRFSATLSGDYSYYRDHGNSVAISAVNPAGPAQGFANISAGVQAGTIPPATPIPVSATVSLPASLFQNFLQAGNSPNLQTYVNPFFTAAGASGSNWQTTYGHPTTGNPEIDNLHNLTIAKSGTGTLVYDFGGAKLKSITGYRESRANDSLDLTGTPTGGGAFVSEYVNRQFSEEIQLAGKIGSIDYQTGAIYFVESGTERSDSAIFYNAPIAAYARNLSNYRSQSIGAFAQLNYHVTDALRLTGGFRYTWDTRNIDRHAIADWRQPAANQKCTVGANSGLVASVAPCTNFETRTFQYPAWTFGIDYKVQKGLFIYAKTSGAAMAGGFNSRPVPAGFSSSFSPERVKDVEIGFKGDFFDRKLRTNVAFFLAKQTDVQRIVNAIFVNAAGAQTLTQFVSNSGKVHTKGFEFEGTGQPWQGMEVTASAAYLDAAYDAGSRIEAGVDRSGEPVTQAPKWTWSLGATQSVETEFGKLAFHADYAYVSTRAFDAATPAVGASAASIAAIAVANNASLIRGYGLLSGRITLTHKATGVELTAWGKNILNQANYTNVFNSYTGIGTTAQYQGAPRTFGFTAAYKF